MATENVQRIYKLTVEGTAAERELRNIAKSTDSVDKQFEKLTKGIKDFAAGVGLGFVTKEIVHNFMAVVDAMDNTLKASQKLGISVEAMQEWQFALQLSGVEAGTFSTAVGKVAAGIADIEAGKITDATKAMRAFGVTSKDTAEQALEKLVVGFSKLSDGPKKTALALEIFGKAGKEMIPLLNSGAAGIESMRKEFGLLGNAYSTADAKRAEAFNDNISRIATIMAAGGKAIAKSMLPELKALTDKIVENMTKLGFWQGAWQSFIDTVTGKVGDASFRIEKLQKEIAFFAAQDTAYAKRKKAEKEEQLRLAKIELDSERAIGAANAATAEEESKANDAKIAAARKLEDARQKEIELQKETDKVIADSQGSLAKTFAFYRKKLRDELEKDSEQFKKTARDAVDASDLMKTTFASPVGQLTDARKELFEVQDKLIKQNEEWQRSMRDQASREQELMRWLNEGTAAQQQYALAQLEIIKAQGKTADGMERQTTELDILTKGYEDFFTNLSTGVANASDIFRRAVQSIIAELLKIWAKKYIIEFVLKMFSGGSIGPSGGGSRQELQGVATSSSPASRSGVSAFVGETTTDATGTAARFTPQAIPRAAGANVEVNVHNNAGAQVDVQTSNDGQRIDIIIEKTRRALAGDLRQGGTVFSKSLESAYALGRARGS